jgi:sugar lactone lactonase YvrE
MRVSRISGFLTTAVALIACAKDQPAGDSATARSGDSAAAPATAQKVGETGGLNVPESVKYDADLDVFFITNINGNPSMRDNNGFIVRVHADSLSTPTTLVQGGRGGLNLNAPKGMAIQGDTLFVTDIWMLRKFNKRTGEYLGAVSLRDYGAIFLNDVAVGPDGIYVTDTGIQFDEQGNMTHPGTNRVFRIVGLRITPVLSGDSLMNPNGIAWDAKNARFILAPFGGKSLQAWNPGTQQTTNLVEGPGGYDGVEVLANGNILVSSWTDSTVHVVHGGNHMMPLVKGVPAPADIGVDTKRNVVAIPRFNDAKVEYYRIP